jgi:hypothetical protein
MRGHIIEIEVHETLELHPGSSHDPKSLGRRTNFSVCFVARARKTAGNYDLEETVPLHKHLSVSSRLQLVRYTKKELIRKSRERSYVFLSPPLATGWCRSQGTRVSRGTLEAERELKIATTTKSQQPLRRLKNGSMM